MLNIGIPWFWALPTIYVTCILENITKEQTTYSIYAVLYSSAQVEQNENKTQNIF